MLTVLGVLFDIIYNFFFQFITHLPFQERTSENCSEAESYRDLLQGRTNEYIEEILAPNFGLLVTFVKEFEFLTEQNQTESLKKYTGDAVFGKRFDQLYSHKYRLFS